MMRARADRAEHTCLRRLSWYFGDSNHGDGLTEGLDGVQRWVRLEIG
jgi:hypothetical protein